MTLPASARRLGALAQSGGRRSPPNIAAFHGLGTGMPVPAAGGPQPPSYGRDTAYGRSYSLGFGDRTNAGVNYSYDLGDDAAGRIGSGTPGGGNFFGGVINNRAASGRGYGSLSRELSFAIGGHTYQNSYSTVNYKTSNKQDSARLAVAVADWIDLAGDYGVVTCVDIASGGSLAVRLLRTAQQDPNVRSGDKLVYTFVGGAAYAISDYLDDKIGTVKLWSLNSGGIPPGWAEMDGGQGGSGIDMSDRVLRGSGTAGSTGGSDTHGHTASGSTTGSAVTGISVGSHNGTTPDDYMDHSHSIVPASASANIDFTAVAGDYPGSEEALLVATSIDDDFDDGEEWTHSVNDSGHTHSLSSITIDNASSLPAYTTLIFIERVS